MEKSSRESGREMWTAWRAGRDGRGGEKGGWFLRGSLAQESSQRGGNFG